MKKLETTQTQTGGSQQEATSPAELRKYRLRWWTLAVVSVTLVLETIDETILNVALPTLQQELGASASGLQWMVNSYILVFGGLLLIMGALVTASAGPGCSKPGWWCLVSRRSPRRLRTPRGS